MWPQNKQTELCLFFGKFQIQNDLDLEHHQDQDLKKCSDLRLRSPKKMIFKSNSGHDLELEDLIDRSHFC